MSEIEIELYRKHAASMERRAYFLLAAAGAAIAFAVTRTSDAPWTDSMWIWAGAILCWALSFFCGLQHMGYISSTTYANMDLIRVESGRHRAIGNTPQLMAAASDGIRAAINTNSNRSSLYARLQFGLLVLGGAVFVAWHVYEMYLRGLSPDGNG